MRTLLVLIVGIAIGAFGLYLYQHHPERLSAANPTTGNVSASAREATHAAVATTRAAAEDVSGTLGKKMKAWHLTPDDIRADLSKSGAVARQNAERAREKVSDVRIVTVIKAKLVLDRDLSASAISVESNDGNVTLTGTVAAEPLIGRAVALALDTSGVHHVTARLSVAVSTK